MLYPFLSAFATAWWRKQESDMCGTSHMHVVGKHAAMSQAWSVWLWEVVTLFSTKGLGYPWLATSR